MSVSAKALSRELRGTKLANRAGALEKLRELAPREQFLVARGFRVGLERDALRMLDAYHTRFEEQRARELAQRGEPPLPTFADDNDVVVPVSADGVVHLHGHLLRVSVEGDQVRVRYLASTLRPHVLVAGGSIDAVESAARALRAVGYEVDVAAVQAVCFRPRYADTSTIA